MRLYLSANSKDLERSERVSQNHPQNARSSLFCNCYCDLIILFFWYTDFNIKNNFIKNG